jgi:thioredoxin-like negative regulator of GroEL
MLRRTLSFVAAVAIIGAVASLVYFNSQPTTFRWAPHRETTLPLAWLILAATVAGGALVSIVLLAREGHWAMRQWKLLRALRLSERAARRRSEARASVLAGRHAKARSLLARTASGASAVIDDAVDFGEAFLAEGRPADGRTHLEDARHEFGDDPRLLYSLARCCRAVGDHASAVAALDRAVEEMPASFALHSLRRDCLVELGWWSRAETAQQRVVDLQTGDPAEKQRLIDIRMKAADSGDAGVRETALRGVLAMDPSWPAAATSRASMLASQGKKRAAVRVLYRAAKRRPAEETLRALDAMLEDGNGRQLVRLYKRLRRAHPQSSELALHYAANLIRLGRNAEAEKLIGELGELGGREAAVAESLRAKMLEGQADASGLADALRRALDKSLEA